MFLPKYGCAESLIKRSFLTNLVGYFNYHTVLGNRLNNISLQNGGERILTKKIVDSRAQY